MHAVFSTLALLVLVPVFLWLAYGIACRLIELSRS
jgi:hypothetical protein